MSAIAHLFGLSTPSISSARTLEIGCASGGHIIPLAAASPRATFVGIDVSPVQIRQGLARIERLGLTNIELLCRSVTDLGSEEDRFDFITCHGVYSWTPDAIREAILRACGERLAPDGVAVVSYNVLPGWRMLQIVRDCAILHAGAEETEAGRAGQVRQLLDICGKHTRVKTSYGQIWRNEAQRMQEQPDAYLSHELFEENNAPCTFLQFATAAARHGLAYLGEANIGAMIPEAVVPEAAEVIRDLSGGDVLASEQYIDILSGRTFRHTLLTREANKPAIDWSLNPARMTDLNLFSGAGAKICQLANRRRMRRRGRIGKTLSTSDPAVRQSIERFIARMPSSSRFVDLAPPDGADAEQQKQIAAAFLKMLSLGMVQISKEPIDLPGEMPERPKAWFVAASDAASGAATTVGRRHQSFTLNPLASALLPLLDGARSRHDLIVELSTQAAVGRIVVHDKDGEPIFDDRLREAAANLVDQCLRSLMRAGILIE